MQPRPQGKAPHLSLSLPNWLALLHYNALHDSNVCRATGLGTGCFSTSFFLGLPHAYQHAIGFRKFSMIPTIFKYLSFIRTCILRRTT